MLKFKVQKSYRGEDQVIEQMEVTFLHDSAAASQPLPLRVGQQGISGFGALHLRRTSDTLETMDIF